MMKTKSDMTVAKEIYNQLGGMRFLVMTGAKNLVGGDRFLSFKVPGNMTKKGINVIKVTLDSDDTYTVEFKRLRSRGASIGLIEIDRISGVYNENLISVISSVTGLALSI